MGVLADLRNRGVKDLLICSVDGLKGFEDAIKASFPKAEIQKCVVHQIRNSTKFVSYKTEGHAVQLKFIFSARQN